MRIRQILPILLIFLGSCGRSKFPSESSPDCKPPSHQVWTSLLQSHVSSNGHVFYKDLVTDSTKLRQYCELLSSYPPNQSWTETEQLAYWINAYNAFTIKLVVDHYPVRSIKDIKTGIPFINSVWDIKFFEIGGESMDLNTIEHSILREHFNEPRIHFAIVCASASCPQLLNEAYTAQKLEAQFKAQTVAFINDPTRNRISEDELELSAIFNWFTRDFTKDGTLIEFIQPYTTIKINDDAQIAHINYDWSLNGE